MFTGLGTGVTASRARRRASVPAKTYADWQAHVASRAATTQTPSDTLSVAAGPHMARVTFSAAAVGKVGVGSPWNRLFAGNFEAAMTHSLPDAAQVAAQKANDGLILFVWNGGYTSDTVPGVTRNGYTTTGHEVPGAPISVCIVTEVSYWDFAQNRAFTMDPFTASGPLEYSSPGW